MKNPVDAHRHVQPQLSQTAIDDLCLAQTLVAAAHIAIYRGFWPE